MADWDPIGNEWALVFNSTVVMSRGDWPAHIRIHMSGRVLATVKDDGSCQIDGVYPGSLSTQSNSLEEAKKSIQESILAILADIFNDCQDDIGSATSVVEDFFYNTTGERARKSWDAAHERFRKGQRTNAPNINHLVPSLPKVRVATIIPRHALALSTTQLHNTIEEYELATAS